MVIKIKAVVKDKIPRVKRNWGYRRELLGFTILGEEKTNNIGDENRSGVTIAVKG